MVNFCYLDNDDSNVVYDNHNFILPTCTIRIPLWEKSVVTKKISVKQTYVLITLTTPMLKRSTLYTILIVYIVFDCWLCFEGLGLTCCLAIFVFLCSQCGQVIYNIWMTGATKIWWKNLMRNSFFWLTPSYVIVTI